MEWPIGTLLGCAQEHCRAVCTVVWDGARSPWTNPRYPANLSSPEPHIHTEA